MQIVRISCPNCAALNKFDVDVGHAWTCEFCGAVIVNEEIKRDGDLPGLKELEVKLFEQVKARKFAKAKDTLHNIGVLYKKNATYYYASMLIDMCATSEEEMLSDSYIEKRLNAYMVKNKVATIGIPDDGLTILVSNSFKDNLDVAIRLAEGEEKKKYSEFKARYTERMIEVHRTMMQEVCDRLMREVEIIDRSSEDAIHHLIAYDEHFTKMRVSFSVESYRKRIDELFEEVDNTYKATKKVVYLPSILLGIMVVLFAFRLVSAGLIMAVLAIASMVFVRVKFPMQKSNSTKVNLISIGVAFVAVFILLGGLGFVFNNLILSEAIIMIISYPVAYIFLLSGVDLSYKKKNPYARYKPYDPNDKNLLEIYKKGKI